MLLCCCWVHEAAGGPPAFCVMEARDGVSSLGIVVLAPVPLLYQQVALGGLCRVGGERLNAVRPASLTLSFKLNPKSYPQLLSRDVYMTSSMYRILSSADRKSVV